MRLSRSTILVFAVLAAVVFSIVAISGCTSSGPPLNERVNEISARLDERLKKADAKYDEAIQKAKDAQASAVLAEQGGDTAVAEQMRQLAASEQAKADQEQKTLAAIKKIQAELEKYRPVADSVNPDGSIDGEKAAVAASALLPPPWNLAALIGLPLITGIIGEVRTARAKAAEKAKTEAALQDLDSVIDTVEVAKAENPVLKEALKKSAPTLLNGYSKSARSRVKSAGG